MKCQNQNRPCPFTSQMLLKATKPGFSFYSAPQRSHCKRCASYSNSVCLPICLPVCLSHISIVSKQLHVAQCSLHCQIAKCV